MKKLLLVSLLSLALAACKENPTPASQAVTTASTESVATATVAETATVPAEPAAPAAPSVSGPKLMPVDEGAGDAAFAAYRTQLLDAVKRRDAEAVAALANPKIRTSFGDGGGVADLRRMLTQPGMWDDFEQLLGQGGAFQGEGKNRTFWAPYTYSKWPEAQDAFESFAVIGENVPLYEAKDKSSKVIAILSHDIVQRAKSVRDEGDWREVKTADGKSGFVEARSVRSPIGYRAGFMQAADGKWQMDALVAGD